MTTDEVLAVSLGNVRAIRDWTNKKVDRIYEDGFASKNLLGKVTGKEMTLKGITITFLENGMYRIKGTHDGSSGNAVFEIISNTHPLVLENGKKYRLVGCPNGGSETTYNINVNLSNVVTNTYVRTMGKDCGNGFNFTINSDTERGLGLYISILPNQTVDLIFKPMLVDADLYPNITYDDFEPYVKSNKELTDSATYKKGDVYNLRHFIECGFLTSGNTEIILTIKLPKLISVDRYHTILTVTKWTVREDGKYLINNETPFDTTKFAVSGTDVEENYIIVHLTALDANNWLTTPLNNSELAVTLWGTISFT